MSVEAVAQSPADSCTKDRGEKQIRACETVIAKGGKITWAYFNLAKALSAKGDHDGAIEIYNIIITLNPFDAGAYVNRGSEYQIKGLIAMAIADWRKAVEIDPQGLDGSIAKFNLNSLRR